MDLDFFSLSQGFNFSFLGAQDCAKIVTLLATFKILIILCQMLDSTDQIYTAGVSFQLC